MNYATTQYGLAQYAENTPNSDEIKKYFLDLMKYMPQYYATSYVINNIENSNGMELGRLNYTIDDVSNQMSIDTATWGLTRWEKEYRLGTNMSLSYEERREIVDAAMAGQDTATKKMIEMVAEKFSGGEVNVIENTAPFYFTVQFVGVKGIPRNLEAFKNMLDDIKPAHMGYIFKYTYTNWDYLDSKSLSYDSLENIKWDDLEIYN